MRTALILALCTTVPAATQLLGQDAGLGLGSPPSSPDDIAWDRPPDIDLPDGLTFETFASTSIGRNVGYLLYRPPGYADPSPLPVVFWLPDADAQEEALRVAEGLNAAIEGGIADPMALVIFGAGAAAGYVDNPATGVMAESVFVRELLPHVEQTFDLGGEFQSRGIAGVGVGGGAAVGIAVRNPEVFGAVASLGGALVAASEIMELFGVDAEAAATADPYPRSIEVAPRLRRIAMLLRSGMSDPWVAANRRFAAHLSHQNLDVDYRELPGVDGTTGAYLDAIGPELFRFLSRSLD